MKDTVRKGNITELKVQLRLLEMGYNVFVPIGDGNKIDLIAIKDGSIDRIQVKTSRMCRNVYIFNAYSTSRTRSLNGKKPKVKYTKNDIDYMATFKNEEFYLIPIEVILSIEPRLHQFKEYIAG